ncbi:MAG: hypothetical protein AAGG02_21615 [Cyanobacteria bacterium P01_H01_bin.15]
MIIADTGFWVALANTRDYHHDRSRNILTQLDEPLVSTWPVITETTYLLSIGGQASYIVTGD